MFERLGKGTRLANQCWRVVQKDRELLIFPAISTVLVTLLACITFFPVLSDYLFSPVSDPAMRAGRPGYLSLAALYVAVYLVTVFFNSAMIASALIRFRGGDPTVRDGLNAAVARLPYIVAWALFASFVGLFLAAMERCSRGLLGIISDILGAAWAVA
ncbi:MAG: DUF6159 family protein, partial [Pseudomonadota bacterium]